MNEPPGDPRLLVLRHWLAEHLRADRERAGLSQGAAAERLGWSASKLQRIETAVVGISVTDTKALVDLYGMADRQTTDSLLAMARQARRRDAFAPYRKHLTDVYQVLLSYEGSASEVWSIDTVVVPGLLQVPGYARALLSLRHPAEKVAALVDARVLRQRLLEQDGGPRFTFLLDEAPLHRRVGGPAVLLDQLAHLHRITAGSAVELRVIPLTAGEHLGLWEPFMIMEIPGSPLTDTLRETVLYREVGDSEHLIRGGDPRVAEFRAGYAAAAAQALDAPASRSLIAELRDRLATELSA
ncbi:helix-turn-helix transcriptional regulator [Actinokineospora sp. NBRC 105648]|uniref:helix-turn-helix domain-containing protein n=1 Tax=Actinokineospora sp. NBRC 105648 TaxID=3032206 RepID=UPI0024A39714|nr:helix-turn-helix transcriptional regulator [Actinokineospora sp. NBRC 105648]GLZ39149.1 transcriptional regulator [Actinokineospora sp. NBRC 105648]